MDMNFTRIKGPYSERIRLPRVGKIRLGVKASTASGSEYPKEVHYFVVPTDNPYADTILKLYGPEPTALDIMLPSDDPYVASIQKYAHYGSATSLKCHGDGVQAMCRNPETAEWEVRACPCEHKRGPENPKGECTPITHLMFLLPLVTMAGVFQVSTGSAESTTQINSALTYIQSVVGHIGMVPLTLRRVPTEIAYQGKKTIHHILHIDLKGNLDQVMQMRQGRWTRLPAEDGTLPAAIEGPDEGLTLPGEGDPQPPAAVLQPPGETSPPAEKEDPGSRAASNVANQAQSILNLIETRCTPGVAAKLNYSKARIERWTPEYREKVLQDLLNLPLLDDDTKKEKNP